MFVPNLFRPRLFHLDGPLLRFEGIGNGILTDIRQLDLGIAIVISLCIGFHIAVHNGIIIHHTLPIIPGQQLAIIFFSNHFIVGIYSGKHHPDFQSRTSQFLFVSGFSICYIVNLRIFIHEPALAINILIDAHVQHLKIILLALTLEIQDRRNADITRCVCIQDFVQFIRIIRGLSFQDEIQPG